jgi:hypothetical protein
MFRNPNASVAEAKKAIANYKKAIGQSDGLAELMVDDCQRASGFISVLHDAVRLPRRMKRGFNCCCGVRHRGRL